MLDSLAAVDNWVVFWTALCAALGDELHNEPIHGFAEHQWLAIHSVHHHIIKLHRSQVFRFYHTYQSEEKQPMIMRDIYFISLLITGTGFNTRNYDIEENREILTSERRRFLGRSFATSGGSTTCLQQTWESNHADEQIQSIESSWIEKQRRKRNYWPVLIDIIKVFLRVLDLTHRNELETEKWLGLVRSEEK